MFIFVNLLLLFVLRCTLRKHGQVAERKKDKAKLENVRKSIWTAPNPREAFNKQPHLLTNCQSEPFKASPDLL